MLVESKKIEKMCSFYISDFHLEMILLPYINKKIKKNEKVVIQSEKDLTDSINLLISRTNLTEEIKKEILNLGWNKKDDNIVANENANIIIIGSKEYINSKNQEINDMDVKKIKVLDCYDFEEIKRDINIIKENYDNTLNTLGVDNI